MKRTPSEPRYAIYYTPPADHPLTVAATRWLGRDAWTGGSLPAWNRFRGNHEFLVAEPRRYGFHATLKAPFRLKPNTNRAELISSIDSFASHWPSCHLGRFKIARLGRFFALVPITTTPFLAGSAARVVEEFDRFRAPMNAQELKRRMQANLDETETTSLVQWGYPYVFDRFRFHMTLTGPVEIDRRPAVMRQLESTFLHLLDEEFRIDALTLFEQATPDSDFRVTEQFPLRAPQHRMVAT